MPCPVEVELSVAEDGRLGWHCSVVGRRLAPCLELGARRRRALPLRTTEYIIHHEVFGVYDHTAGHDTVKMTI